MRTRRVLGSGRVRGSSHHRSSGHHAAVYAPKSALGHSVGAVGALESVLTVLAVRDGLIPPTLNLDNQDPDIDLDVVKGESRSGAFDFALNNSFGFGGTTSRSPSVEPEPESRFGSCNSRHRACPNLGRRLQKRSPYQFRPVAAFRRWRPVVGLDSMCVSHSATAPQRWADKRNRCVDADLCQLE